MKEIGRCFLCGKKLRQLKINRGINMCTPCGSKNAYTLIKEGYDIVKRRRE